MNLAELMQATCQIALEAGEDIMRIYQRDDLGIEYKADESPLTAADLASHQHITESLKKLTPQYPILSEESAQEPFEVRQQWETYWLIDPLDGTREFVKRNDQFSMLIALIHQQKPVLGVVYAPALQEMWFASLGNGAFKATADTQEPFTIHARATATPPVVIGSKSHRDANIPTFLENMGEHEYQVFGSIIKACRVAEGSADLYPRLGLTSEWDTAAAQIIVEEAGGHMLRTDMTPMRYNTKDSLLNPFFFVFGADYHDWSQYLPENNNGIAS